MRDTLPDDLAGARLRLLASIEQPELSTLTSRARRRRWHRRTAAGGAALALAALAGLTVAPRLIDPGSDGADATGLVDTSGRPGLAWSDHGLTVDWQSYVIRDLPGELHDIEFVDADRGFLLSTSCTVDCAVTFAATTDGGDNWQVRPSPFDGTRVDSDALPLLFTFGTRVVLSGSVDRLAPADVRRYTSTDGGRTWRTERGDNSYVPATAIPAGSLLHVVGADPTGCGQVAVLGPDSVNPVPLADQPELSACWVARAPAIDGAWWVGGRRGDRPAVAASRDGGRTWSVRELSAGSAPVGQVQVVTAGTHVYAVVLDPSRSIQAIHHSADFGGTFTRTGGSRVGEPSSAVGDVVSLPDGRLLLVARNGGWYLSADHGATFTHAEGLRTAGSLRRTPGGYVVRGLLGGPWAGFSPDGRTWRKLPLV